jgi:hypothetical protein
MRLAQSIVDVAAAEIGVEELNGTNCGPRVDAYKGATSLDPSQGWPWCAAFVCWVVREAMARCGVSETPTFRRPTTAGAWALELWSLAQDATTQTQKPPRDIKAGDIVIFTFSHCGIAIGPITNGMVQTIEGNTDGQGTREGGAVLVKRRPVSKIRSRIRFTI